MSSTSRGHERMGGADDFYVTPSWCVRRLLADWQPPGGLWLEPGAGNGSIIRAVNSVRTDVTWAAVEIRREEETALAPLVEVGMYGVDFLDAADAYPLNELRVLQIAAVLGNPPFIHAQQFIDQSRLIAPAAPVCMLLRLNFLGSDDRAAFFRTSPPDLLTLPNRPSFFLRLTDSIEYAWFIWPPGERDWGRVRVLPVTSIAERQLDMPEVGRCQGPCGGTGWLSKEELPAQKKSAYADHPCPSCVGFGKVKTGPSAVEREWKAAA